MELEYLGIPVAVLGAVVGRRCRRGRDVRPAQAAVARNMMLLASVGAVLAWIAVMLVFGLLTMPPWESRAAG